MAKNPKNPKKTEDPNVIDEKAQREFEELRARLRAETEADMVVLRALLDAERQARGLEQAAEDYAVGAEWRVSEADRAIDAQQRAATREAVEKAAAEAAKEADEKIAAVHADAGQALRGDQGAFRGQARRIRRQGVRPCDRCGR